MDDILDDDLFGDDTKQVDETVKKDTDDGANEYKPKQNVKKKDIDLFTEEVLPKAIDFEKMKVTKTFTLAFADSNMKLSENEVKIVKKLLTLLKEKGFRIRVQCNTVLPIWDLLIDVFDNDDITVIKPWPKFCPIEDFRIWLPKDVHKQASAYHTKNFDKLPTAVKFISSALMATLFGPQLTEAVEFVLVFDPYSTKDKIDFKQARDCANFIIMPKMLRENGPGVYNIAKTDEIKSLLSVIK